MKIGYATADWSQTIYDGDGHPVWGGSGWARCGQYIDRLEASTVAGLLIRRDATFGVRDHNHRDHWDCDIIVMQRYMHADVAEWIPKAKANGQVIINDLDDWYWGLSTTNDAFASSHPKFNPDENVNHYRSVLSRSTAVHVSTPYLADRISRWVRCPVHVIPNFVDYAKYPVQRYHEDGPVIIGWVGSTSHRSRDLETLRGIMSDFERRGVRFHHSGHSDGAQTFAEAVGVSPESVTTLPLVPHDMYPYVFKFDIGIVPLNNVPFNLAKSYIKGLEYTAAGVPFVAPKLGAYDGLDIGRIARRGSDWTKWLNYLLDAEHRREDAARNREVGQKYDIQNGIELLNRQFQNYAS